MKSLCVLFIMCFFSLNGQTQISGRLLNTESEALVGAYVELNGGEKRIVSDKEGRFSFQNLTPGQYTMKASSLGYEAREEKLELKSKPIYLEWRLNTASTDLQGVEVSANRADAFGKKYMSGVENFGIYEGKKTEVIDLLKTTANLATNNARQVFAKIPGLNIWESDGAGLQLGIGGRGLSPNRTSNFNTRQNGYDISADPLGYPESYYTPPMEALERIEIVRGAASLQYGTQFGGMLNFVFQKPDTSKAFNLRTRLSGGSFGFLGAYAQVSGTLKQAGFSYFGFVQHRKGDGWRPNSAFDITTAYLQVQQKLGKKAKLGIEMTAMDYLAQQPGGMSDAQFERDPRVSSRARNWFQVKWKLPAVTLDWQLNPNTGINVRTFGMISEREALGNLERIHVADLGGKRTLIENQFRNYGVELRLLKNLQVAGQKHTFLLGSRYFKGQTLALQGDADNGDGPSFKYLNPADLEGSDFDFDNQNLAAFAEYIFRLNERFSITPGLRFEYIRTGAAGYYKQRVLDFAGNVIADTNLVESNARQRLLLLGGLGLSWKMPGKGELYANFSQNYRAINFTDLRVNNPNLIVDPNIRDERGYTIDLGARGNWRNRINYDISAFSILYRDRIGQVLKADQPPLFLDYRLRSNVADARLSGIEVYLEADLLNFKRDLRGKHSLFAYVNGALIHARYFNAQEPGIEGNKVEQAPPFNLRWGLTYRYEQLSAAFSMAQVAEHFTDATNARRVTGAVSGVIPAYQIADLSLSWKAPHYSLELSCNNLFDARYFTRRAEAYPGPGIIPGDGRGVFATVEWRW